MPTTPYAKILVSVNGGGNTSGGLTVPSAAVIVLSPESTVGWGPSPKWEIYGFPSGYTAPAGWSTDGTGVIFYTGVTPPGFTLPAAATRWGKWMLRLTVNGTLIDEATALSMLSPLKSLRDIGIREGAQFGGALGQWIAELQADLRIIEAIAGGGGSVPTGTGFSHVTGGSLDVASKKVDLTAAADVTVPATANGVVTSSGAVLQQAANVLAGSGFISVGAVPSTSGEVRVLSGGGIRYRDAANANDKTLIECSTANDVYIGTGQTFTAGSQARNISMYAGTAVGLGINGTTYFYLLAGNAEFWSPCTGSSTGGTPYGINGTATQAMADAPQTLAVAVYKMSGWIFTGAETANRTATIPAATDAQAYEKQVQSNCTGGFNIVLSTGAGTTVSVGDGAANRVRIRVDSRGVTLA